MVGGRIDIERSLKPARKQWPCYFANNAGASLLLRLVIRANTGVCDILSAQPNLASPHPLDRLASEVGALLSRSIAVLGSASQLSGGVTPGNPVKGTTHMLIKACLNGARDAISHPALPQAPAELAKAAQSAVRAGAGAIHMHPRSAQGAQSLEPADIGAAIVAVRAACPGVPVGVSTLFTIVPDPAGRAELVASWSERPDFASVNFGEPGTAELCGALQAIGVGIEAGLDTAEAAEQYVSSAVFGLCLRVLIEPSEPGLDLETELATVAAIEAVLDHAGDQTPRLLHGEGPTAWSLLDAAIARGYDTRIGLEDVLTLPDGSITTDNAALVAAALRRISGRREDQ
jgi:uncharacterized protein (DUF849 family)